MQHSGRAVVQQRTCRGWIQSVAVASRSMNIISGRLMVNRTVQESGQFIQWRSAALSKSHDSRVSFTDVVKQCNGVCDLVVGELYAFDLTFCPAFDGQ